MLLDARRDGAEFCLLSARSDKELVVVEELCVPLWSLAALLAVPQHLVDCFGNWFLDLRRFALDYADGQPVHKKNDVRNDVMLGTWNADFELRNGDKGVILAILKIDLSNARAYLPGVVINGDRGVFQQIAQHLPVVFNQIPAGKGRDAARHLLYLVGLQEWIYVVQCLFQFGKQNNLAEVLAKAFMWLLFLLQANDSPSKRLQLHEQRLFDVLLFVEF